MKKAIFVTFMLMSGFVAAAQMDIGENKFLSAIGWQQASINHNFGPLGRISPKPELDDSKLREMIGQMIMVGFYGSSLKHEWPNRVARQLSQGDIGGVIFMQRNVVSRKRTRQLTELFLGSGSHLPPLIAVDQEGGRVQRLTRRTGFTYYPSARDIARRKSPAEAKQIYRKLALELGQAGFNFNLGPVLDLNINTRNPVIGRLKRSYGKDPQIVAAYSEAFIQAHRSVGVVTSVKHFPGHGSSRKDSHKSFIDLSGTWSLSELSPYRELMEKDMLDTIMVGHLYHPSFAGHKKRPATLSSRAVQTLLRRQLGFEGVVITDDLEMAPVRKSYSFEQFIEKAVNAGNDILLFSNNHFADPEIPKRISDAIIAALKDGRIFQSRIVESYNRIVALKKKIERRMSATQAQRTLSPEEKRIPN